MKTPQHSLKLDPSTLQAARGLGVVRARLFEYDDYRSFLRDYFEEQKRIRRTFTHRFFARKAGFSNPSYCHYLIQGRYNLSPHANRS